MYNSIKGLIQCAKKKQVSIWQVVLENECRLSGKTADEVFDIAFKTLVFCSEFCEGVNVSGNV